jgi:hypothetical protein
MGKQQVKLDARLAAFGSRRQSWLSSRMSFTVIMKRLWQIKGLAKTQSTVQLNAIRLNVS